MDVIDLSIHPVYFGAGGTLLHEGLSADLRLASTKTFFKIVS